MSRAKGPDISFWQTGIDYLLLAANIDFIFIRACWAEYKDVMFDTHWAGMAGRKPRGAYCFFRPERNIANQAQALSSLGSNSEIANVLDVEYNPDSVLNMVLPDDFIIGQQVRISRQNHSAGYSVPWLDRLKMAVFPSQRVNPTKLTITAMRNKVQAFVNAYLGLGNEKLLIYTSPGFWNANLGNWKPVGNVELWVAHWYVAEPQLPQGFNEWKFHQDSNKIAFPGIPDPTVDRDFFHGTVEELHDYLGLNTVPHDVYLRDYADPFLRTLGYSGPRPE